ncbi:hypothetical protein [Brevundimonas sp.]|uniref:hypothetical protein n=1 Tax=Brevundimonas sp. TaxID=1871086 RepID=UPI003AF52BA3
MPQNNLFYPRVVWFAFDLCDGGETMTEAGSDDANGHPDAMPNLDETFAAFLHSNPSSRIVTFPPPDVDARVSDNRDAGLVLAPWGDESLAFVVPDQPAEIADVLNVLVLPEQLSAVWHTDSKKLEVIWTARKLTDVLQPIVGRKFRFNFRGKNHECEFARSSDRLLTLAKFIQPLSTSETFFRNLQSFAAFVDQGEDERDGAYDQPKSFWISNIEWDPSETIEIIKHLNFYLTYFDNQSPYVIVHDISKDSIGLAQKTRYIKKSFPSDISATEMDQNLLTYWEAAPRTNQVMQFIIYYRMIEYCSMQYVDHSVRAEIKRLVSAPDVRDSIGDVVDGIINAVNKKTLDEPSKLKSVIRNTVDPKHIWADIKESIEFFSEEQEFEGGFRVRALVGATEVEEGFCKRGLDQFTDTLRRIRNALSHGKDHETDGVILPTQRNMEMLRPWVHLIATAAGEVALYKGVS